MKIKNIDSYNIEECCEQLKLSHQDLRHLPWTIQNINNPTDIEQQIIERLKSLLEAEDKADRANNIQKKVEFERVFNRYFATQRYVEAFALCLQQIQYVDDKSLIKKKAEIVIPKLTNCILIPCTMSISYDWLIDRLVLKGYEKMKYADNALKWKTAELQLESKGQEQTILTKCRIRTSWLVFLGVLYCLIGFLLSGFVGVIILFDIMRMTDDIVGPTIIGIILLVLLICIIYKIVHQPRMLLREIAGIMIDHC